MLDDGCNRVNLNLCFTPNKSMQLFMHQQHHYILMC